MTGLKRSLMRWGAGLGLLCAWGLARTQTVDLPACEKAWSGDQTQLSLGIVQPGASQALVDYAVKLSIADSRLSICAESWDEVLPRWIPWSEGLEHGMGWLVFALAFVTAVTLLWRVTPSSWWQRTTLLGMLGVTVTTWVLSVITLFVLQSAGAHLLFYDTVLSVRMPRQVGVDWINLKGARDLEAWLSSRKLLTSAAAKASPKAAAAAITAPADVLVPNGNYVAIHRLNLRSGPGIQYALLMTIDHGDTVWFAGERQGDWWHVRNQNGTLGWSSSLWLRQPVQWPNQVRSVQVIAVK